LPDEQELVGSSKERSIAHFRYCVEHELGMSMMDVADRLKITVPAASAAVKKGDKSSAIKVWCYRNYRAKKTMGAPKAIWAFSRSR